MYQMKEFNKLIEEIILIVIEMKWMNLNKI